MLEGQCSAVMCCVVSVKGEGGGREVEGQAARLEWQQGGSVLLIDRVLVDHQERGMGRGRRGELWLYACRVEWEEGELRLYAAMRRADALSGDGKRRGGGNGPQRQIKRDGGGGIETHETKGD